MFSLKQLRTFACSLMSPSLEGKNSAVVKTEVSCYCFLNEFLSATKCSFFFNEEIAFNQ